MPRGHLKKDKALDAKSRRGGHSKNPQKGERTKRITNKKPGGSRVLRYEDGYEDWSYDYEEDRFGILFDDDDDNWTPVAKQNTRAGKKREDEIDECGICYDEKPVLQLTRSCNHVKSCFDCFRHYYIVAAQRNVGNYPLRCWHPACSFRLLHTTQIENFARTPQEMKRHYRLSTLARAQKDGKMVAHCPKCDHPRAFSPKKEPVRVFCCLECGKLVAVMLNDSDRSLHILLFGGGGRRDPDALKGLLSTLDHLEADSVGPNDGWALCPSCHIIISKGNGCDHMHCSCGRNFSWKQAKEAVKKIRFLAGCLVVEPSYVP